MNRKNKMKSRLAAGALAVGLVAVASLKAGAAPITILNQSFETFDSTGVPDDWLTTGNAFSAPANYTIALTGTATGSYFVQLYGQYGTFTATQTTTQTASLGDTYTLTVALGYSANNRNPIFSGAFALEIGGTAVAFNTTTDTPVKGSFFDSTLTYTVTDPTLAGGAVGVELLSPNAQPQLFDNVRLDVEPASVPEPSAWALMFAGLLSLITLRSFRRSA